MKNQQVVILFVTSVFDTPNTGPATYARLLYEHFKGSNVIFHVITSDSQQAAEGIIPVKKTFIPSFVYLRLWRKAKAITAQHRDSVVITHYNNSFPYLFFGKIGSKSIIQLNDYYNISTPYFQFRILSARHIVSHMLRKFTEYISMKRADIIVSNSHYTTEIALKRYHLNPEKFRTIYKSLNLNQLGMRQQRPHNRTVLYIGNNLKLKGFDVLAEALTMSSGVNELHIAGPSKDSPGLAQLITCIPPTVKIIQHGALKQEQLYSLMTRIDLVAIPARFEALGVAVIESLAQSVPVLTTGVGGLKEVLANYPALFSDENNIIPERLAANIDEVFARYDTYYSLTFDKIQLIRAKFNPDNMMRDIETLYRLEE